MNRADMNTAADIRFVLRSEGVQTPVRFEGCLRKQDTVAETVTTPAAFIEKATAKRVVKAPVTARDTIAKTAGEGQ